MSSNSSRIRNEVLRSEAEVRQAESDKLTIQQKLDRLPAIGANRQRARYMAALETEKSKSVVKDLPFDDKEKKRMKKENKTVGETVGEICGSNRAGTSTSYK